MPTDVEDREEIRRLLARYNQTIDANQADEWVDLFVDDAVVTLGDHVMQGSEELRTFAEARSPGGRHVNASEVIDVDGDRATVRLYVLLYTKSPATLVGFVDAVDEFVRVDGHWRFARRTAS